MENVDSSANRTFEAAPLYFSNLDADVVAALVTASTDLALIIDAQGVIRDVALGSGELRHVGDLPQWIGRRWIDTVTVESRPKIAAMLEGAAAGEPETQATRPARQVNHPMAGGTELPVSYHLVPLGETDRLVALGRDLRAVAAVQQRLVDAQQSMERDYLRLRHSEARYRLLFEAVEEAIIVVDAPSLTVVELNAAAARLLGEPGKRLLGRPFGDFLHARSQVPAATLMAQVRSLGRGDELAVSLASGSAPPLKMSATVFKQDNTTLLLVRLVSSGAAARSAPGVAAAAPQPSLLSVANAMPDAFVLTDLQGRIFSANQAFADMLQLPSGDAVPGQSLDRWLGRSSVDLNVLIANLRQHGMLRLFPTTLRSAFGEPIAVEISAVAIHEAGQACLGFSIRDVARRLGSEVRSNRQLPRSAEQLTGLVGRLPLKDIVGETTDLIERLCIEAALELTRDNRASAAEMLGLSRQSLYVKLRRYGIQDSGPAAPSH